MRQQRIWRAGLQAQMTISYVWVTMVALLLVEILAALVVVVAFSTTNPLLPKVQYTIQHYAAALSEQMNTAQPSSSPTYLLGDPAVPVSLDESTIASSYVSIPYTRSFYSDTQTIPFALLVGPDGHILASSYPRRYPVGFFLLHQLSGNGAQLIEKALRSTAEQGTLTATSTTAVLAVQQVWNQHHRLVPDLYMQTPVTRFPWSAQFLLGTSSIIGLGFFLLLGIAPLGGLFSLLTTRGLLQRLRHLARATSHFADGDYSQRVRVMRPDEVGQLEQYFNRMAEQLVVGMTQRQELAEQNARLAERTRISRELHDAILQDLFALNLFVSGLLEAGAADALWRTQLVSLKQASMRIVHQMRALLLELRPASLEHLPFNEGVEELAAAYSTRLGIVVTTEISSCRVSPEHTHALLRIAREALSNAIRHADATRVTLRLTEENETLFFTVTDNGKGFTLNAAEIRHGMGLRTMQERVQELGGTWMVESTLGHGTQIQASLPQEAFSGGRL